MEEPRTTIDLKTLSQIIASNFERIKKAFQAIEEGALPEYVIQEVLIENGFVLSDSTFAELLGDTFIRAYEIAASNIKLKQDPQPPEFLAN
jgi:hypothetical protein